QGDGGHRGNRKRENVQQSGVQTNSGTTKNTKRSKTTKKGDRRSSSWPSNPFVAFVVPELGVSFIEPPVRAGGPAPPAVRARMACGQECHRRSCPDRYRRAE